MLSLNWYVQLWIESLAGMQAREESNRITLENERLIDERDSMENRIKLAADTRILQLEESFEASMTQARTEAHRQMEVLRVELEQLRRAANGDACGWQEYADGTFSNAETGEYGIKTMPEALAFARAVQRVIDMGSNDELAKVAQKRAQDTEMRRRELDVKLNEARADARSQRDFLDSWGGTARSIVLAFSTFKASSNLVCDVCFLQTKKISKQCDRLKRIVSTICQTAATFKEIHNTLAAAKINNMKLVEDTARLDSSLQQTQLELSSLRNSLDQAVEAEVEPMRAEISRARDAISRERVARIIERGQLASLWPIDQPLPVALRRHVKVTKDERRMLFERACGAAAETEIKVEVRRRVADALKWSEKTDDYGRKYYVHSDTGNAAWDPPIAMLHSAESVLPWPTENGKPFCHRYEPPPGRNDLGMIVGLSENVTKDALSRSLSYGHEQGPGELTTANPSNAFQTEIYKLACKE